ncbi:MAG: DUF1045 domain-containing protein [Pseudomonadota bacterium]
MESYSRYAIYFTAAPGSPLADRGASWLGWDIERGSEVAHPELPEIDIATLTKTPRKYGFHGTLKPPFRLGEDQSFNALEDACAAFASRHSVPVINGLRVAQLGAFLALVPDAPSAALDALAAACVREFDTFRAPPTARELEKRRGGGLSARQEEMLARWGYPYVLSEFRFHMTLSGRLQEPENATAETVAKKFFQDTLTSPFAFDAITLCGERADGRFDAIQRFSLLG